MLQLLTYVMIILICAVHALPLKVPTERYTEPDEIIKNYKRMHPGLYPFIGHMTFRNTSDIVIDAFVEWFDPDSVKQGDIIYLNIWYLEWFVENVHDRIKHPYILLTCDVGDHIPTLELKKLLYDPKCAAWFGRNIIFSYHPKITQIPMGQDLTLFSLEMGVEKLMQASAKKGAAVKQHLLYMNQFPRAWGDRDKIVALFEHAPYCFTRNHSNKKYEGVSFEEYYDDLLASRFVLSPLGYETDCIRTWEALTLGCIPIVEHSFLDPLFENLPVALVHNWESIDEQFLKDKYDQLKELQCSDAIYFDFWFKKIKDVPRKIRNNDMPFASVEASLFNENDLLDLSALLQEYGSDDKGRTRLFYRGFFSAARPLQLASEIPTLTAIHLHDAWLDEGMWNNLEYYLTDHSLLMLKNKVRLVSEQQFASVLNTYNQKGTAVFLDLSFYRHSLYWDEYNKYSRLRHSLKNDMQNVFWSLKTSTLLFGNMIQDNYVKEVLMQFAQENDLFIETKGNFWFCRKKKT